MSVEASKGQNLCSHVEEEKGEDGDNRDGQAHPDLPVRRHRGVIWGCWREARGKHRGRMMLRCAAQLTRNVSACKAQLERWKAENREEGRKTCRRMARLGKKVLTTPEPEARWTEGPSRARPGLWGAELGSVLKSAACLGTPLPDGEGDYARICRMDICMLRTLVFTLRPLTIFQDNTA